MSTSRPGLYVMVAITMLNSCDSVDILEQAHPEVEPMTVTERVHLPTKCKEFYNDGTDRWVECMGVGYK